MNLLIADRVINIDIPVLRSEIGFNCFAMNLKRGAYAYAAFNLVPYIALLCVLREWHYYLGAPALKYGLVIIINLSPGRWSIL